MKISDIEINARVLAIKGEHIGKVGVIKSIHRLYKDGNTNITLDIVDNSGNEFTASYQDAELNESYKVNGEGEKK